MPTPDELNITVEIMATTTMITPRFRSPGAMR